MVSAYIICSWAWRKVVVLSKLHLTWKCRLTSVSKWYIQVVHKPVSTTSHVSLGFLNTLLMYRSFWDRPRPQENLNKKKWVYHMEYTNEESRLWFWAEVLPKLNLVDAEAQLVHKPLSNINLIDVGFLDKGYDMTLSITFSKTIYMHIYIYACTHTYQVLIVWVCVHACSVHVGMLAGGCA